MSAIDRAEGMRGPVETFAGFAHLEVAAIDDGRRLAALVAICDDAMEASQRLLAERPADPDARGAQPSLRPGLVAAVLGLVGGGAEEDRRRRRAAMDAWHDRVDALEAQSTARVAAWRDAADAGWLAAAVEDRDAALDALVVSGAATREMVDIVREHPFGDLMLRAALAHD